MTEFLPVGTVVLLKGATRPVVIIGYTTIEEGSNAVWDYLGCSYPFGVMGTDQNLLFQRDSIEKIVFRGYEDEEGKKYLDLLKESIKKLSE